MTIRHTFANFGTVQGTLQFADDSAYDACEGRLILVGKDGVIIDSFFNTPAERDELLATAFAYASQEMYKFVQMRKGF